MRFPPHLTIYGNKDFRGNCPVESAEQVTFFNLLRKKYPNLGTIAIHPRNEGKRSFQQTARHKAEGMTKGAPDIIIPAKYPFICELKRRDHTLGRFETGQLEYLTEAQEQGAFVCIALGYDAAFQALEDWLTHKEFQQ
jgi:hypothetical protein